MPVWFPLEGVIEGGAAGQGANPNDDPDLPTADRWALLRPTRIQRLSVLAWFLRRTSALRWFSLGIPNSYQTVTGSIIWFDKPKQTPIM